MQIYQTRDMERAIRAMSTRNDRKVVFRYHAGDRKIHIRTRLLEDIPSTLCRPWDDFADSTIARWQEKQNLLYYLHNPRHDKLPECDALFYEEIPIQHTDFLEIADRVKKEIIIYRPPDWAMQEDALPLRFSESDDLRTVLHAVKCLQGQREWTKLESAAVEYAEFPPEETTVFTGEEIEDVTELTLRRIKTAAKYKLQRRWLRWHCYIPRFEPDTDPVLREMYRVLLGEPDIGKGVRALRFGELRRVYVRGGAWARVPGFKPALKLLVRGNYVAKLPDIYMLRDRKKDGFDYEIIDAISEVRWRRWHKMREMVEAAPEYPL